MSAKPIFVLSGMTLTTDHHRTIKDVRLLNEEELTRIDSATGQIREFTNNCDLFGFCDTNYEDLISHLNNVTKEFQATRLIDDPNVFAILKEANRLLLNYLASFMAMVDHYQTRYKRIDRQGTNWSDAFNSSRRRIYDGSFAYRFFYILRQYIQHCELPITGLDTSVQNSRQGPPVSEMSIFFKRDGLLHNFNNWRTVKHDLQSQPPQMEVAQYLTLFHREVQRLFGDCTRIELEIAFDPGNFLWGLITEVETQIPGATPLVVDFGRFSDAGGTLGARYLPEYDLKQMRELQNRYR